jgi:glycosyltransferase involved in cell wall biosynthesis
MAHILFSAVSARRGGGLTYIRNIVRAFPGGANNRLSVMSADPIEGLPEGPGIEWIKAPRWAAKPISRFLFGAIYFRFFWPRRREFDAIYFAGGSFDVALPPSVKTIVAFRNMLPFDLRSRRRYGLGWIRFRHWLLRYLQAWAFRRADLVIFISDFARQTIDRMVPNRANRSVVIPHGVSHTSAPLDPAIVSRLPERFVLYLSIIDVYKAQVELVEAWAQLRQTHSPAEKLVLAGPEYPPYAKQVRRAIRRHGLEDEVILLGAVRHDQVSDLTSRAVLNLFLSACENCPNILLELMGAGRALLVSDRQPMPELGGPDLDYVDPYDVRAVAAGLARLLDDPTRRDRVALAARARGELYTWEQAGALTWQAILGCVGDIPAGGRASQSSANRQAGNVQR